MLIWNMIYILDLEFPVIFVITPRAARATCWSTSAPCTTRFATHVTSVNSQPHKSHISTSIWRRCIHSRNFLLFNSNKKNIYELSKTISDSDERYSIFSLWNCINLYEIILLKFAFQRRMLLRDEPIQLVTGNYIF